MVDFSEWKTLLRRLGGKKVRRELIMPGKEPVSLVVAAIRSGGIVRLSEDEPHCVEVIKDGLLSLGGKQVVLYIYQTHPYPDKDGVWRVGDDPKFHFVYCETLRKAKERVDRYIAHAAPDDPFPVRPLLPGGGMGEEALKDLLACKNCIRRLTGALFASDEDVRNFDRKRFFRESEKHFPDLPEARYDRRNYPLGGYPGDWDMKSRKVRRAANWTCDECGMDCSSCRHLLHTHHINGVLADCSEGNLRALCVSCHSEQPHHHLLRFK